MATSKKAKRRTSRGPKGKTWKTGRFVYSRHKKTLPDGRRVEFRSLLEKQLSDQMDQKGVHYEYETLKLKYRVPAVERTYNPDFILENGIIIEAKGKFDASDRRKMLLVKETHPDLDIRFVFQNSSQPIYKGSKTTNRAWAEKHSFPWAHRAIPEAWLKARPRGNL